MHHAHRQTRSPLRVPVVKGRIPYSYSSDSPLQHAQEVHASEINGVTPAHEIQNSIGGGGKTSSLRPPVITKQMSSNTQNQHHAHAMASVAAAAAAAAAVAVKSGSLNQQVMQQVNSNHVTGLPLVAAVIDNSNHHSSSTVSPSSSSLPLSSGSSNIVAQHQTSKIPVSVNLEIESKQQQLLSSDSDHNYKSSREPKSLSSNGQLSSVNIHNHQNSPNQLQPVSHRLKASSSSKSMKMVSLNIAFFSLSLGYPP